MKLLQMFKFFLLTAFLFGFGCVKSKPYPYEFASKEENNYDDSLLHHTNYANNDIFIPVLIEDAKRKPFDFIEILNISDNNLADFQNTDCDDFGSILMRIRENSNTAIKLPYSREVITKRFKNSGVSDYLKDGKIGNYWAILYCEFNRKTYTNYWVAISNDDGVSWKHYDTGLTANLFYQLKQDSEIPLLKDPESIQIEGSIVRFVDNLDNLDTVKSSIVVRWKIKNMIQDSDNDGLTDIVEKQMMLNPNISDSDNDGIIDSIDSNPRFESIRSNKSILYDVLIERAGTPNLEKEVKMSSTPPKSVHKMTIGSTYILVTDDKNLQGLNPQGITLIIMTSSEYLSYKSKYPYLYPFVSLGPMFKSDNEADVYKASITFDDYEIPYIVKKTKKGWKIWSYYFLELEKNNGH